ncbi:MAG: helix-turn-helix transcriptional regulator, partial [Chloroflexi bacterium]
MATAPKVFVTGEGRVSARHAHRRQRLMHAALDLFADLGYEETSVGTIVARAKMSKSAFYEYFNSK